MLKNYFNTAIRNLFRNKVYAFINISGLALGISCCLLISLYVYDEMNFDNFHAGKDRLYRVAADLYLNNEKTTTGLTSLAVGPSLEEDFPEVEAAVRMMSMGNKITIRYEDKMFYEEGLFLTDSTYFKVFSFDLLAGHPDQVLTRPKTIVLTKTLADKYFGHEEAVGKVILINNKEYEVVGVMQDPPSNTDLQFKGLASINSLPKEVAETFN